MNKRDALDAVIDTMAEVVKPLVQSIEASIPTTQNHYAEYMTVIHVLATQCPVGDNPEMIRKVHIGIGVALQRAGANHKGVQSALRAMGML